LITAIPAAVGGILGPLSQARAGSPGRIALQGYDPVSYFTPGHPEQGLAEFSVPFDDTTYWFANEEHRKMFAADPERYAPQFRGYCAASVAKGVKFEADPEAWTIWNGKLFVFGGKGAVPSFSASPGEIAGKANATWATLKDN
jgi:YHS domain-containing protein